MGLESVERRPVMLALSTAAIVVLGVVVLIMIILFISIWGRARRG